jgi:hypothetical protein
MAIFIASSCVKFVSWLVEVVVVVVVVSVEVVSEVLSEVVVTVEVDPVVSAEFVSEVIDAVSVVSTGAVLHDTVIKTINKATIITESNSNMFFFIFNTPFILLCGLHEIQNPAQIWGFEFTLALHLKNPAQMAVF